MRAMILVGLLTVAMTATAGADAPRMSNTEFVDAGRCVTLASAASLQADRPDVAHIAAAYNAQTETRSYDILKRSQRANARILRQAARAQSPAQVADLRADRDRVCASFLSQPTTVASAQ